MSDLIVGLSIIIGSLLFGLVAIFGIVIWIKSHRLRIRVTTDKKTYVKDFWVIETEDRETNELYWRNPLFFPKVKIERPPMEVIEVGKRGRMYAEAKVLCENGDGSLELLWLKDNSKNVISEKMNNGEICEDTFKPFSTTSKAFIMNQFKKAVERKSKRWDLSKITQVATLGMFGLCFMLAIIFMPDILDAMTGTNAERVEYLQHQEIVNAQLQRITNDLALITEVTGKLLGQDLENLEVNAQIVQNVNANSGGSNVIITENETQPTG